MPPRIGDKASDFTAESTEGTTNFHECIGDRRAIAFSHPKDFSLSVRPNPVACPARGRSVPAKSSALASTPVSDHEARTGDRADCLQKFQSRLLARRETRLLICRAMSKYHVYILASRRHRHISIGVTRDLRFGVTNHRLRTSHRLSRKRAYQKLVLVETLDTLNDAIGRERQLKGLPRAALEWVIESANPGWKPLSLKQFEHRSGA